MKAFLNMHVTLKYEGKDQQTIDQEMEQFHPTETLRELSDTLNGLKNMSMKY